MISDVKSSYFHSLGPIVWLVDNGSLRAESVLALRRQAAKLAKAAGCEVAAVSVLHSAKIDLAELGGVAAEVFVPALRQRAEQGLRHLLVIPYFFGPSAALTEYLPYQIGRLQQEFPGLQVKIAPPLVDLANEADDAADLLAQALAAGVLERFAAEGHGLPSVIMVDHGSPQADVSAVRDRVGGLLRMHLAGKVRAVWVASMEAREGEQYAHTRPLLAELLAAPPFCHGRVIVAPLFLSPGRHAGSEGDLMQIATAAMQRQPGLAVEFCELLGERPQVTQILLRRLQNLREEV